MVVLTTGETATTGMLAVLANTSVTGRYVATVLASLAEPGRHFLQVREQEQSSAEGSFLAEPSARSWSIHPDPPAFLCQQTIQRAQIGNAERQRGLGDVRAEIQTLRRVRGLLACERTAC